MLLKVEEAAHGRTSPDETRLRIMTAAHEIFSRAGTRGTTTREIAEVAGVNEATIFRHFGSKTGLLDEMREHFCAVEQFKAIINEATGDIEHDLKIMGRLMVERIAENREMIVISMAEEARDTVTFEATWRGPNEILNRLTEYLAGHVAAGTIAGNPRAHARCFMGMIVSYVIQRKLWESYEPDPAIADYFVNIFLNGARSK